jgi:hypothetical protein
LQLETLEGEVSGTSSSSSSEDSSDGVSSEETSNDERDRIYEDNLDEDLSMSDISSSSSDSTLTDDKLDFTDSGIENNPPRVFDELKQMYSRRYEIPHVRSPKPQEPFMKHLLSRLKGVRLDHFRCELRVSPLTFDRLVEAIKDDPVFVSHSEISHQAPVEEQLAVALYRFGHNGNAASLQTIANWAGIGGGTIELHTHSHSSPWDSAYRERRQGFRVGGKGIKYIRGRLQSARGNNQRFHNQGVWGPDFR